MDDARGLEWITKWRAENDANGGSEPRKPDPVTLQGAYGGLSLRGELPMPHPAQIRDAVQACIERQDRPVRTGHVQDEIASRLDTRHALVYEALMRLEQAGAICKHVSPENGTEYWFSGLM